MPKAKSSSIIYNLSSMPQAKYSLFIILSPCRARLFHYSLNRSRRQRFIYWPSVVAVSTRFDLWTTAKNIAHSERLKIVCLSASRTSAYRREFRFLASGAISFLCGCEPENDWYNPRLRPPNDSSSLQKVHLKSNFQPLTSNLQLPTRRFPPVLDVSTRFDLWTTTKNIAHSERLKIACLSALRTSA